MLALLYPICADIDCTSFPSSKQALIAEIFKFTDGCRGCSAVLTPRKPFGFCQGLSRFAIHAYNACFDGYPNRRMTSAIDCVASYIASAFSFCSLVYIIPSFLPVQDFVRRGRTNLGECLAKVLLISTWLPCCILLPIRWRSGISGKDIALILNLFLSHNASVFQEKPLRLLIFNQNRGIITM